jgi:hypothetical protein
MPKKIYMVTIQERGYTDLTKYVYADSEEEVRAVDEDRWGEVEDYMTDGETTDSEIAVIELVENERFIESLERTRGVQELPHEHGDWVVSSSCGAWICSCDAHFTYNGKDKEPGRMLARCYCGWAANGGNGKQQLAAMGENVEDDY